MADVCHNAVRDDEEGDIETMVINRYLVEHRLCECDVGRLELYNTERLQGTGKNNGIATFVERPHRDRVLHCYEVNRVTKVFHQSMKKRLTHLFLRRQTYKLTPPIAEHGGLSVNDFYVGSPIQV